MLKACKPYLKEQNGFTLIEVIISITLLALMMVYMVNIIDNSIKTKESVLAEDKDFMQIETALARFDLDFSQIYSPLFFSATGAGPTILLGDRSRWHGVTWSTVIPKLLRWRRRAEMARAPVARSRRVAA